jgi:hypothetical protein
MNATAARAELPTRCKMKYIQNDDIKSEIGTVGAKK